MDLPLRHRARLGPRSALCLASLAALLLPCPGAWAQSSPPASRPASRPTSRRAAQTSRPGAATPTPGSWLELLARDDAERAKARGATAPAGPSAVTKQQPYRLGAAFRTANLAGWSLGGYGELSVATRFFGPDPSKDYALGDHRQTDVDLARMVFFVGYQFTSWLSFTAEIEFEHGGTGATMEVEWDEFGEYEAEIEKGGEVVVEQAFIEANFTSWLGLRVGHLLVPVGMISGYHTPLLFSTTSRAESESALIPSTWHESGAELYIYYGGLLGAQLQLLTGLDSTGFSSQRWIAGGSQRRFEAVSSNDWAIAARFDYFGLRGLLLGASFYTSDSTGNRPKQDMEGISGRVFLTDIHLRLHRGPLRVRALAMFGWLQNAAAITEKNSSLSKALGAPRTPVGSSAYAYYLEVAYDILGALRPDARHRLDLFIHYDGYDTMWSGPDPDSGFDNPLLQRQVLTAGINYLPHPRVVIKAEYLHRWINKDEQWSRRQHELNLAAGFVL